MATRKRAEKDKQVPIDSALHKELRIICLRKGVTLRDLVNMMVRTIMGDEEKLAEMVAELEPA